MLKFTTFLSLFFSSTLLADTPTFGNFTHVEYVSNYDGDTVRFNIPNMHPLIGQNIPVRLAKVDTPEIRGKCAQEKELAKQVKADVARLLSTAKRIDLINVGRPKYFRILADIQFDGQDLGIYLLGRGLAAPYSGGTKKSWCPDPSTTVVTPTTEP